LGGPVAQQGRAADWSYGTRLRLLTRRSGVQFPSGPPYHFHLLTDIFGFSQLISCNPTFNKPNVACYKKRLVFTKMFQLCIASTILCLSGCEIERILSRNCGEKKTKKGRKEVYPRSTNSFACKPPGAVRMTVRAAPFAVLTSIFAVS
jgi:hypothetical protein